MIPTFHGLETARRGLNTQQLALYTTGHNIANANTEGYTRQRVEFSTTNPYPGTGFNRPGIPGQIGTGVTAGAVSRVRESFLDAQYRLENNKLGYYSLLSSSLSKMEDIMNEPTDSGFHSVLEKFWNALQDLSNNTENSGAREVVATSGQMLAETINYYYNSLTRIKTDLGNEINVKIRSINSLVSQIDELNRQIAAIEPHGQLANDLYDKRDLLVDELSGLVNIKVTSIIPENYGNALPTAEGLYQIEIVKADGTSYSPQATLINVDRASGRTAISEIAVFDEYGYSDTLRGNVAYVMVGDRKLTDLNFSGELAALIESYGYQTAGGIEGLYPEMLEKLNKLTYAFASEFNYIHQQGFDLKGEAGIPFFLFEEENPAATIRVHDEILADPAKIAAAGSPDGGSGDNENVKKLADIKSQDFTLYEYVKSGGTLPDGMNGSIDSYYSSIIGNLGVRAQSANRNMENTQVLVDSVENNRQSNSAVSLDEEMTHLIKYQHAYNASARIITVLDEMLDRIINGMGTVGR